MSTYFNLSGWCRGVFGLSKYAVFGLMLALAAGTAYHYIKVNKLNMDIAKRDKVIAERDQQILALQSDVSDLKLSNSSLELSNQRKTEENTSIREELVREQVRQDEAAKRVAEVEEKLRSRETRDAVMRIQKSGKTSLLLLIENKYTQCVRDHYGETGGRCRSGKWVLDGERVVPRAKQDSDSEKPAKEEG